jgi:hypothetical protein
MMRPIIPVCGYPNVLGDSTTVNDSRFGLLKEVKSEYYAMGMDRSAVSQSHAEVGHAV